MHSTETSRGIGSRHVPSVADFFLEHFRQLFTNDDNKFNIVVHNRE